MGNLTYVIEDIVLPDTTELESQLDELRELVAEVSSGKETLRAKAKSSLTQDGISDYSDVKDMMSAISKTPNRGNRLTEVELEERLEVANAYLMSNGSELIKKLKASYSEINKEIYMLWGRYKSLTCEANLYQTEEVLKHLRGFLNGLQMELDQAVSSLNNELPPKDKLKLFIPPTRIWMDCNRFKQCMDEWVF